MGEKEKVMIMVLKVDLQCDKCYKKVKNVLCKFPQIRDQNYDEKQNQVVIKVVSCSPETIRDKICCKGGGAIKSIEIIELPPPPPPPPPRSPSPPPPQPPPPPPPVQPVLVVSVRVNVCCIVCCQGHPGGPCYCGYGYGRAPHIKCDYCGMPVCDSCCKGITCPDCFSEENPLTCRSM